MSRQLYFFPTDDKTSFRVIFSGERVLYLAKIVTPLFGSTALGSLLTSWLLFQSTPMTMTLKTHYLFSVTWLPIHEQKGMKLMQIQIFPTTLQWLAPEKVPSPELLPWKTWNHTYTPLECFFGPLVLETVPLPAANLPSHRKIISAMVIGMHTRQATTCLPCMVILLCHACHACHEWCVGHRW